MKEAPLTQQKTPAFICYKDVVSLMEKQHMDEWSINGIPGYLSNAQDDHRKYWLQSWGNYDTQVHTVRGVIKSKAKQPAPTISAFLWAQDIQHKQDKQKCLLTRDLPSSKCKTNN